MYIIQMYMYIHVYIHMYIFIYRYSIGRRNIDTKAT